MKNARNVSLAEIKRAERNQHRPTTKVFFYNKKDEVFFFHREGRFSLPGGGIDGNERLYFALLRELEEELFGATPSKRVVQNAPVLKTGILPTSKPSWKGKRVWVLGIYIKDLTSIQQKDESHYDFRILHWKDAVSYIATHEATPEVSRKFYVAALRKLAKLKGWKV